MDNITKETRKESYKKLELKKKSKLIYDNLDGEYTARELANKLYKKRLNKNGRQTRNSTAINWISRVRLSRSSRQEIWFNK